MNIYILFDLLQIEKEGVNIQKIALIFPNFYLYENIAIDATQPPLSLGYLAGVCKEKGIEYEIIDAACEKLSMRRIIKRISQYSPTMIGITTNIAIAYASLHHAFFFKKHFPRVKIIMGGPWASAEYEFILKNRFSDFVVVGEGEKTFEELILLQEFSNENLKKIKGLAFISENMLYINERRPLIENIDDLPSPQWDKFPKKGYTKLSREKPIYPILTSRGCPYQCINCTKIIHGTKMRYRSIHQIIKELDYLKRIGAKEISIEDDIFNSNLKRAKEILKAIIKKGYNFKIQLANGLRADNIDEEFAKLAAMAGVYKTAFGVESGSPAVVKFIKKNLDLSVINRSIRILHKYHIKVTGYFILGFPIETPESVYYTIKFASNLEFDSVSLFNLIVFPGTELHEYIINHGISLNVTKPKPGLNYQYAPLPFNTPKLNEKVLKKFRLLFIVYQYLRPKNLFRFLKGFTLYEFKEYIIKYSLVAIKRILKKGG